MSRTTEFTLEVQGIFTRCFPLNPRLAPDIVESTYNCWPESVWKSSTETWARLVDTRGFTQAYNSVKRFCGALRRQEPERSVPPPPFLREKPVASVRGPQSTSVDAQYVHSRLQLVARNSQTPGGR